MTPDSRMQSGHKRDLKPEMISSAPSQFSNRNQKIMPSSTESAFNVIK